MCFNFVLYFIFCFADKTFQFQCPNLKISMKDSYLNSSTSLNWIRDPNIQEKDEPSQAIQVSNKP